MHTGEGFHGTEQGTTIGQNKWEKMASEVSPFNPDQKETKDPKLTETKLAEAMLEQSADRQDELVSWINGARKGHGMNDAFYQAYDRFREDNVAASEEDWAQSLEQELSSLEARDNLLVLALEDLDSPTNAGKSLEEILNARADKEQDFINARVQSGAWANKMTDEQRNAILTRRDIYQSLAEQAKSMHEPLGPDADDDETIGETATPEQPIMTINSKKLKASIKHSETSTEPTETNTDNGKTEKPLEQDSAITNSEAEVRAIMGALKSVRPGIQQLFAMSKGSLSAGQAAGNLLIFNQHMIDSTGAYAEILKNAQDVGQIEQFVATYDQQINVDYGRSINAIDVIRQKSPDSPCRPEGPDANLLPEHRKYTRTNHVNRTAEGW